MNRPLGVASPNSERGVSLSDLASAVLGSCRPFTSDERAVVRTAYRVLAYGVPVPPEYIAVAAGVSADVVSTTFARWPGLARLDQTGRVIACLGLSLEPTQHRLEIDGRELYTWCAWDSLFIPRLLGATAAVTSRCPVTGSPIQLLVTPNRVAEVKPAEITVSFLLACDSASGPSPMGACCPHIHFLRSPEGRDQWLADHPAGFVLSLDEAWQLGRLFVDTRLSSASAGAAREAS